MSITVAICTYNECKTVESCIRSVLASDSRINEVIIIDDKSKDATKKKVKQLKDSRVHFYSKNHKKYDRGKNDSLYMAALLSSNENMLCLDCDTLIIDTSDIINKLEEGYDLVGGVISVIENDTLLSHCERVEYDLGIAHARPWLYENFHYLNNVSGAFFGIKRTKLIENRIPKSVVGEDMYLTQIGLIQGWRIKLSTSEVQTYSTPGIKALFIQRCRWVNGAYSTIKATGRKTPLIEMTTTYYRMLATGAFILLGLPFTAHFWTLTGIVLLLYFMHEFYRTKNAKDALLMMAYRQINFFSALMYFKYGRVWRVIR